jgi:hypothetical protein
MIKKQFTLYMENKPGELAKVTRMLADKKINIEGISVSETTDVALVQLVVSDPVATRNILKKLKIPFTVQDVMIVLMENKPGSLARITEALAKAKININYVYATACNCGQKCGCQTYGILSAPDIKKAEQAWKQATQK